MVDEVITVQGLIDAHKDAQSLEEFISGGDEQIVVTRLLKEYPTLANAIRQIYEKGGKFYPTLADANADIANIRTDVYVITGDSGTYYKATPGATTLTKSAYDPLAQAKAYADQVGLASNNYTDNKISVIRPLYNPTNNVTDKYINSAGEVASLAGAIMAVIPIQAGKTYAVKSGNFSATLFFIALRATNSTDVGTTLGKVTLTDTADPSVKTFTVPVGSTARYALINVKVSTLDVRSSISVNQGTTIQTAEKLALDNVELVTASDLPNYGYLNATDVNKVINNLYSQQNNVTDKYINSAGEVASLAGLMLTIIPVEVGKTYSIKANSFNASALFIALRATNSTDVGTTLGKVTLTDTADPSVKTFTVPVGSTARYALINVKVPSVSFDIRSSLIVSEGITPIDGRYVDKIMGLDLYDAQAREDIEVLKASIGSPLTGKEWIAIGDSITEKNVRANKNYHDFISEDVGGMTVYNKGISGSGFHDRMDVAETLTEQADYITILWGTNDFGLVRNTYPLGTFLSTDTETISGRINTCLNALITKYPLAKIAIISALPRLTNYGSNAAPNSVGYTLKQHVDLLKQYAAHYSLPFLNLYEQSNLPVWIPAANQYYFTAPAATTPDGLHPNDAGQRVMADKIKAFLESI